MAENDRDTITIKGTPVKGEALASGVVKPGYLLERTSAATDTVKAHATKGGKALMMFALEDDLQGDGIDDNYASGDLVQFGIFRSGDEVLAWIANGQAIAKADDLSSNGDGTLSEAVPDSSGIITETHVIARAREACDMSGSSAVDPSGRCIVEIL